jgi:secondary thiamine-phosphate synthase enzyme
MKIKNKEFKLKTKKTADFIDITHKVEKFIAESKVKEGLANIQSMHTTAAIIVNENEPLLIKDMEAFLEKLASNKCEYNHDNFEIRTVNMCDDECVNGHSHCKAILLPTSVTLNIVDSKLQLGQWQRIFLRELDRSRPRKVQIQIIGE